MKKKIGLVSLGCPKNLVDSELVLGKLSDYGYEITGDASQANIIIINTCGFIESAKQESIDTILEMCRYKEDRCELVIVSGCMAERYKEMILEQIPEVNAVIGTGNYDQIADVITSAYKGEKNVFTGNLDAIDYLENKRILSVKKGYAYLKIAEGCDNCCTYCIIPSLRGRYRSRKMEDILREAKELERAGAKEIILIAQDTTRYGEDLYGSKKLVQLIREISLLENIQWIRLLYCYPEEIDDELINELANNPKVCKYIDIPIQHISDGILKRMGRRGNASDIRRLLDNLRQRVPGIVIRTTFIVGFPGEEDEDFQELYDFVESYRFERMGVFTYSREEDTPAAKFKPQVKKNIKNKRYKSLMSLQQGISRESNDSRMNRTYKVLVEGVAEDGIFYVGRSYAEAPEIDGSLYFSSGEPLQVGDFVNVKILNIDEYDLIGVVENEFTE